MRYFESLTKERPELLNIPLGERQMLERLAARSGRSSQMELATYIVGQEMYRSVTKNLRARRVKVKRSALIPEGEAQPPAGIDDVLPPDLIEGDENDAQHGRST